MTKRSLGYNILKANELIDAEDCMTVSSMVAKMGDAFYWVRRSGDDIKVRKYAVGKTGDPVLEAEYAITEGKFCSCPQMQYRGGESCKHVKMANGKLDTKPVPLEDARKVVKAVKQELAELADQIVVPDDWAEKNDKREVIKVRLKVYGPRHEMLEGTLVAAREGVLVELAEMAE